MVAPLVIGGAMAAGSLMGGKSRNNGAQKFLQMAYDEFGRLRPPTPEEMQYQLQALVQQGVLRPEEAEAVLANPTAFLDVDEDPSIRKAQMGSLAKLQGIVDAGGLDMQGKADIAEIVNSLQTTNKGTRGAIVQNAAQRGVGGSGLELANQLTAAQESATNASQQGLDAAALAERRALEAIMATGQLSGDIRSADYRKSADKAAAIDAMEKFNVANKNTVGLTNVAARNAAQDRNLTERQRLSDANTLMVNEKRKRDTDLKQTDFENKMRIAAGKTGQLGSMANLASKEDDDDEAFRNALLGAGGQIMAGYAGRK